MTAFICPLCQQSLQAHPRFTQSLVCPNNHQFDIAKEGYLNLLPVQKKSSKDPGDNAHMMQNRRLFLEQGYYQFMRDAVVTAVQGHTRILDLGCGEGYYTAALASPASDANQVFGIDISKAAIKRASKRYGNSQLQFAVASCIDVPLPAHSVDAVVSIFAPAKAAEIARLLTPQGILVSVSPGPWHLKQFKALVYDEVRPHQAPAVPEGFTLVTQQPLSEQVRLDRANRLALLTMTPFFWRFNDAQLAILDQPDEFVVDLDFDLRVYRPLC